MPSFGSQEPLESFLTRNMAVVLRATEPRAVVHVIEDVIQTLSVFDVVETLSSRDAMAGECSHYPLPTSMGGLSGKAVVGTPEGQVTIDGVTVIADSDSPEPEFKRGDHYLVLGHLCPSGVFLTELGPYAVFHIDPRGGLEPAIPADPLVSVQNEILRLGTVDRLRAVLKK